MRKTMGQVRICDQLSSNAGGDPECVVIAGDSAGGNLAAAVTIGLRNEAASADSVSPGPHQIKAQLLLYPATDLRDVALTSESCLADRDPTLRMAMMEECRTAYLQGQSADDWRVSPQAADLRSLPPALVVVLDVDPLRDSGINYAKSLQAAGVRTELIAYPHLTHGFAHVSGIVPAAQAAFDEVISRFRSFALAANPNEPDSASAKPAREQA
ncbi:alpha/beta hydrolase fold domain-containing protein [Massilia phosphatilytica]